MIKVDYKVFVDNERKPLYIGSGDAMNVLSEYAEPQLSASAIRSLQQGERVNLVNRRKGLRITLTNSNKAVKVKRTSSGKGFISTELEGVKTETQIKVAAADMLKSAEGYHRTVCIVKANGLSYKVKCMHKGLTYTDTVHKCKIVERKVL